MPLKNGYSQATIGANIKTLMDDYDRTGKIGNSQPKSRAAAQRQAVAIAESKADDARKRAGKRK